MSKNTWIVAFIAAFAAAFVTAGCGGGGGTGQPSINVVAKGRVVQRNNPSVGVPGAVITIGGYSGISDSNGYFRIVLPQNATDPTFSIVPPSGYFPDGVIYNSEYLCARALPVTPYPLRIDMENDLGSIMCFDASPPPPPPDCP